MVNFYGQKSGNIDAKNRVALPAQYRKKYLDAGVENLLVVPNLDMTSLYVFDEESFDVWVEELFERVGGFNKTNKAHEKVMRMLTGNAREVTIDSAGRITLDAKQYRSVGLDKEILLVGTKGHFEIWPGKSGEDELEMESLRDFFNPVSSEGN